MLPECAGYSRPRSLTQCSNLSDMTGYILLEGAVDVLIYKKSKDRSAGLLRRPLIDACSMGRFGWGFVSLAGKVEHASRFEAESWYFSSRPK